MTPSKITGKIGAFIETIRRQITGDPGMHAYLLMVCIGAFSLGCLVYISLVLNVGFTFSKPSADSEVVGWITMHQYPKQQEIFYYVLGILSIAATVVTALCGWVAFSYGTAKISA